MGSFSLSLPSVAEGEASAWVQADVLTGELATDDDVRAAVEAIAGEVSRQPVRYSEGHVGIAHACNHGNVERGVKQLRRAAKRLKDIPSGRSFVDTISRCSGGPLSARYL